MSRRNIRATGGGRPNQTRTDRHAADRRATGAPNPVRPNRPLLVTSTIALVVWIVFLLVLAVVA